MNVYDNHNIIHDRMYYTMDDEWGAIAIQANQEFTCLVMDDHDYTLFRMNGNKWSEEMNAKPIESSKNFKHVHVPIHRTGYWNIVIYDYYANLHYSIDVLGL